jgi:UPF0176 protein
MPHLYYDVSSMDYEAFPYWVLAFYHIGPIADPHAEVKKHKKFFSTRDIASRVYFSEKGVNGQMSASKEHAIEYMQSMHADERFKNLDFKIHGASEQAFPKVAVRYRRQLVAMDCDVDLSQRGRHVSPKEWKRMLEEKDSDTLLVDVRNSYESAVGHFEGAELPLCETFRQFPEYARSLKEKRDPKKTRVMMYCTGGIRCEFYSALLKEEGFEDICQLDGGVIGYGLHEGNKHWKGKLFVFDDRITIPISGEVALPIAGCRHCNKPMDVYHNCANTDCNELFVCCPECLVDHIGCCSTECMSQPRVRPYRTEGSSKPFRKWNPQQEEDCERSALSH